MSEEEAKRKPKNPFDDLMDEEMDDIMSTFNFSNITIEAKSELAGASGNETSKKNEILNSESPEKSGMTAKNLNSENRPFVFFEIDEIKNFTLTDYPKTQQIKTCGYFYHVGKKIYLYQHPNAESTSVLDGIEVGTEMLTEFPVEGKLYESFGGLIKIGGEDQKLMFTIWFYRMRTGKYNDLVELGKKMRETFCQSFI